MKLFAALRPETGDESQTRKMETPVRSGRWLSPKIPRAVFLVVPRVLSLSYTVFLLLVFFNLPTIWQCWFTWKFNSWNMVA